MYEPYDERTPHIPDPILHFACLDAALAMKPVFRKFPRIVHSLAPLLNFNASVLLALFWTLEKTG